MLFDNHLHTVFSFDSKMEIQDALIQAETRRIGLAITDHLDLNMDYEGFDPAKYRAFYEPLRSPALCLGTEVGMDPRYCEENRQFAELSAPDFVLGSVHALLDDNIYARSTHLKYPYESFWPAYFSHVLDCLKSHPFIDSLAHLDYPARLSAYGEKGFCFSEHEEGIEPIFQYLIDQDIALELNLKRFLPAQNRVGFKDLFSIYREMGGRTVTLGSDAHQSQFIGKELRAAFDLVSSLDLKAVHFYRHEPVTDRPD